MVMPAHDFGDKYVHKCWSRRCLCLLSIHLGSTLAYFDRWPFSSGFDPSFRDSDVKLKTEGKMHWRSSCRSEKVKKWQI